MSQLNFYVSDDIEDQIKLAAKQEGKSISAFLADLVKIKFYPKKWDDHFFDSVVGKWDGELSEPVRELPQNRNDF